MDDQQILQYCLEKWNENFSGINSWETAKDLNLEHTKVRNAFRRLKEEKEGTLTDNVQLYSGSGEIPEVEQGQVEATIFFPSENALKGYLETSKLAESDIPPFQKAMRLGHRPSELWYFSSQVLERYLNDSKKYNIRDLDAVGFFSGNKEYLSELDTREAQEECFSVKRYGKIFSREGQLLITAILEDLADLPKSEQGHWMAHQTEAPTLSLSIEFQRYYLKFFKGAPIDSHDPLHDLLRILQQINKLPHLGQVFKNINESDLKYPAQNTYENFSAACKTLYRLIGPESIDSEVVKRYLRRNFNYRSTDLSFKSTQERLKLFKKFLNEFKPFGDSIDELTQKVKEHKILDPENQEKDYLMEFRKLCQGLLASYDILYEKLKVDNSHKFRKTGMNKIVPK